MRYLFRFQTFRNTLLFLLVKSGSSRKQTIGATAADDFSGQFGVLVKLEINRISIRKLLTTKAEEPFLKLSRAHL